jgi:HPt (histidine-containing phosphotransfer) domain-containing protein
MSGELSRCLAAGMDGLLTKPLEVVRLRAVLEQYIGGAIVERDYMLEDNPADTTPDSIPPIDTGRLRALIGEDEEFVRELCQTFISTTEEMVPQLERALAAADRATLGAVAHKLKGGSQSICAERIAGLAMALERGAPSQSLPDLAIRLADLRAAITDCMEFLRDTVH